jgi:hypothetical protein
MIPSTSIQKNRYKEKINQSACLFGGIALLLIPLSQKGGYAGNPADFEMLPAAMGRDCMILVGTEVALCKRG